MKKPKARLTTIRGVVIPIQWDENGNVVRIAISSHDETEYLVEHGGKGEDLLACIRKEVQVQGETGEGDHRKTIVVKKYQVR